MDEGNYSKAEIAYRKMMAHDPDFLIGLSLLGRITKDLDERKQIELSLESRKEEVSGDERILLNMFTDLVKLTNQREINPDEAKLQAKRIFKSGEQQLIQLVHKYPDEIYYKAEYIEVLHRNYGAEVALDSMSALASPEQQNRPFLTGYSASLEAEIGLFESALKKAESLFEIMDKQSPKPYVVHGDIYYKMGNFDKAREFVAKALIFDSENIDALRLMSKISSELNKK